MLPAGPVDTVDKATGKSKPHGIVLDVTSDPDKLAAREAADKLYK